ncbi:MAG TPA: NAD-dependent epimerase/dehydratase family protein [Bacteroidota bacterium]|nr:NAD-dependent epimerase/dehydratase family protein [Bacteroidota bacterium]
MTNKIVFLTGSTGFIGSKVAHRLITDGWKIRGVVRDPEKAQRMLSAWGGTSGNIELVKGDLFAGSPADRRKFFAEWLTDVHAVVHLAEAKKNEKDFDVKNIKSLGLLLEAATETPKLERFVFVSAFMAGGLPRPLPKMLTEEMTGIEFPDPYYQWKRMAERLLIRSATKSRFSYAIVRPALVYGPNAEWLVPMLSLIKRMGSFFVPLANGGKAQLGTVHVDDAASTIASAASSNHAENQIIHAVDNGGTTYVDWFESICSVFGRKPRLAKIPEAVLYPAAKTIDGITSLVNRHYGVYQWALVLSRGCGYSNEKMRKIIGELKYPSIRDGIPGMMEWFRQAHG